MKAFAALLVATLFSGAAQAQSFDCRKAGDLVDKTICSTPELSALDAQLGATWQSFRAQRPDLVQQAKTEGVVWFRQRKLCAASSDVVGCIRDLESARIQKLSTVLTAPSTLSDNPVEANTSPEPHQMKPFHQKSEENACGSYARAMADQDTAYGYCMRDEMESYQEISLFSKNPSNSKYFGICEEFFTQHLNLWVTGDSAQTVGHLYGNFLQCLESRAASDIPNDLPKMPQEQKRPQIS